MLRATLLFLLLWCIAATALYFFVFSGQGTPPPGGYGETPPAETGDRAVGGNRNPTVSGPGPSTLLADLPPNVPFVTITVMSKEKFVPPAEPVPLAFAVDGRELPAQIWAGAGAGFDSDRRQAGISLIAVSFEGGRLLRQIAVDLGLPQPAKIGARIVVRGRVLDLRQRPIPDARVWLGELVADGSAREVATDQDGAFETDVPAGRGVPFVVRADGYASKWRALTIGPNVQRLTEVLQPAVSLQIQVAARVLETDQARAFVVPDADVATGVAEWPFFRQCLSGGYQVDANGRVLVSDLPQGGSVGIIIRHPLAVLRAPVQVRLREEPLRVIVPVSFLPDVQRGVVVDEGHGGIDAVSLWVCTKGQRLDRVRSLRLLPPHLDMRETCYASTNANGRFVIGVPDDGEATLSLRAHGYAGRDILLLGGQDSEVVLPEWQGGDASLRILPPVAGKAWSLSTNLGGGIEELLAADEVCQIALPHVGRFTINMVLKVDGMLRGNRDLTDLMVTGPVDVVTPHPN